MKKSLFFREFFQSSGKKGKKGHRLVTLKYFSRGELSSSPRYYIRVPFDEKFRGVLSNLDASMPTSMLVEVGGGFFSTKNLIPNHGPERLITPKNVAEGHQTSTWYHGNELI